MSERPIIFSKPMVNAILAGRKSQTRRIIKRPLSHPNWTGYVLSNDKTEVIECGPDYPDSKEDCYRNPYGVPGDKLWVRETCRAEELADGADGVRYLADDSWRVIESTAEAADKWVALNCYQGVQGATVPSIFMPRWASRLTLEITDIRVQRLQEINAQDAMAEGVVQCEIPADDEGPIRLGYMIGPDDGTSPLTVSPQQSFMKLWDSIHGKRHPSFSNPWVWAIGFQRL
jgi:hypothetical protein